MEHDAPWPVQLGEKRNVPAWLPVFEMVKGADVAALGATTIVAPSGRPVHTVATPWYGSFTSPLDGSGYQYKRNRYLDPATGRFTQEDPIGLAGGLNLHGFPNGDPVGTSDPFGLCDESKEPRCSFAEQVMSAARAWVAGQVDATIGALGRAGNWIKENGLRVLLREGATQVLASAIPVIGEVRAGRRIAAVGEEAGRFLSESSHLRNAAVGARHDWVKAGLSADEVVGAIAARSGWEATSGFVPGSLRIGERIVDYTIFNGPGGEAIVNAWLRGVR